MASDAAEAVTLTFVLRVLGVVAHYDQHDALWWRTDAEYAPVTFFAMCSDVFVWGAADAEPVTPDRVDAFEWAYADCYAAVGDTTHGAHLFAARMRGQRPQGAAYPSDTRLWALFDACGPPREPDMLNPHRHPAERDLPTEETKDHEH